SNDTFTPCNVLVDAATDTVPLYVWFPAVLIDAVLTVVAPLSDKLVTLTGPSNRIEPLAVTARFAPLTALSNDTFTPRNVLVEAVTDTDPLYVWSPLVLIDEVLTVVEPVSDRLAKLTMPSNRIEPLAVTARFAPPTALSNDTFTPCSVLAEAVTDTDPLYVWSPLVLIDEVLTVVEPVSDRLAKLTMPSNRIEPLAVTARFAPPTALSTDTFTPCSVLAEAVTDTDPLYVWSPLVLSDDVLIVVVLVSDRLAKLTMPSNRIEPLAV